MTLNEAMKLVKERLVTDAVIALSAVILERDDLLEVCKYAISQSEVVSKEGKKQLLIPYSFLPEIKAFIEIGDKE